MIGLNANSLLSAAIAQEAARDVTATAATNSQGAVEVKPAGDVNVDLSSTGRSLSASKPQKNKNSDIDDTNLPDAIKQTLKLIREIKAKLQEKLRELQAAMADQRLTTEQRKARALAIQSEIGSLSAAWTSASATLLQLMNDMKLSDEQKMTAGMLSMS